MNANYSYLDNLENVYQNTETAAGSGRLPNGRYTAILNEARLYAPDERRAYPRFSTSWIVTEGDYKGRLVYLTFNFNEKGFPYYKAFAKALGIEIPHLRDLPDRLGEFSGKIGQLTLAEQKSNPQYQNVYFDRLLGTGNPSDYRPAPASAPSYPAGTDDSFTLVEDDGDLPF